MPKSGSREPEGQLAEGNPEAGGGSTNLPSGNSEAEGRRTNPPRATPKRCVPKSGSREPEGQPAEQKRQPTERQPRSGACRKAEVVNPKANPLRVTPKRKAEAPIRRGQPRSGACRKAKAVSPKANPPSGNPEAVRTEKRKP